MGQRNSSPAEVDGQCPYHSLECAELERLVLDRGIILPQRAGLCSPDRDTLTTLLKAFDEGAGAKKTPVSRSSSSTEEHPVDQSALDAIQKIRDAPGHMGVDIGGTLVKMAIALPAEVALSYVIPESFGETGRRHSCLELPLTAFGDRYVVHFVSASTTKTEQAVERLLCKRSSEGSPAHAAEQAPAPRAPESPDLIRPVPKKHSSRIGKAIREDAEASPDEAEDDDEQFDLNDCSDGDFLRGFSGWSDVGSAAYRPVRRIAAAGGGACKFAPLFRTALRLEIEQVKELSAVVEGLLLLVPRHHEEPEGIRHGIELHAPAGLFTVDAEGRSVPLEWPEKLFPFFVVNMGSGVSILQVDSPQRDGYVRVGGTACGGGTFLGLARALTSARTFEEALALAETGDASRADKLVSDIYGMEGSSSLGLAGSLTAANFGKLCDHPTTAESRCSEQDLARALLQMVTQQSVLLASAFAKHAGCVDRVFFVGGFVDEPNHLARRAIAANFRSLGGCAYFLRHSDFLGSLGSLQRAFQVVQSH